MSTWVILGCGYIGSRLARALLADGERVIACSRNRDTLAPLEALGAEVHPFEASRSRAFRHALGHERRAIVVHALPPVPGIPPGDIVHRVVAASLRMGVERFVYLSSIAIYGEGGNDEVVSEETPFDNDDPEARMYIGAEGPLADARANGLDTLILRLAPVYGPGRGVRERLLAGTYKLLDDGQYLFSRIHVDDVVGIIRASVARAPANATYCLADDRPCPQKEYTDWLCEHLDLKPPPSVPTLAPGQPRRRVRNRAVSNARLKRELDYAFRYPSYVEGESAIDADQGVEVAAHAPAPLVIHRKDELAQAAERSRLRRLQVDQRELAPGARSHLGDEGEAVVYVLSGAIAALHGDERHELGGGDMVEVPTAGLELEATGAAPARLLVLGLRY